MFSSGFLLDTMSNDNSVSVHPECMSHRTTSFCVMVSSIEIRDHQPSSQTAEQSHNHCLHKRAGPSYNLFAMLLQECLTCFHWPLFSCRHSILQHCLLLSHAGLHSDVVSKWLSSDVQNPCEPVPSLIQHTAVVHYGAATCGKAWHNYLKQNQCQILNCSS